MNEEYYKKRLKALNQELGITPMKFPALRKSINNDIANLAKKYKDGKKS